MNQPPKEVNELDTLLKVPGTLLQKPDIIKVSIVHPTKLQKLLIRAKLIKPCRVFEVPPLVLGKMIQISELLLKMDLSIIDKENVTKAGIKLVKEQHALYSETLAIALSKGRLSSKNVKQFIIDNMNASELLYLVTLVIKQMQLTDFIKSIVLMSGWNLLAKSEKKTEGNEASPLSQRSSIAPGN